MVELENLETKAYLNAEDDVSQTKGAVATIASEADYVEKVYKGIPKRKLEVTLIMVEPDELIGEERTFTMNKTTERVLAKEWGKNSEAWLQKKIHIYKSKASIDGEMKDVLYAEPHKDDSVKKVDVIEN